jgi:pimeloyl-ACP methyl ester carboxylesterase
MGTHTVTADELFAATARFDREAKWDSLRTGRYQMRYAVWGDAPRTLLFVHGLCDLARSFAMPMANLLDDFRCVALELPNGKDDDAKLGTYRHDFFPHEVVALLDHLKLDRVDILGSSFGSTVALRTAAIYPDRLRRIVLQGGFARRPLIRAERGLARIGRYWPWRMGELPIRETVMRKLESHAFVTAPPEIFEFLLSNSGQTPVRAASRRALILDKLDLRPILARVTCPVLMIGGDRDTIVPRRYEAEVEAGVPDVRRVEFSPCGHYPQYTHPAQMAVEMRKFLCSQ